MVNAVSPLVLHGIGVSTGIVIGKSLSKGVLVPDLPETHISANQLPTEIKRLEEAISQTSLQLQEIRNGLVQRLGEEQARMLDFHIMLLEDEELHESILKILKKQLFCAEQAVKHAISASAQTMREMDDEYMKARAEDIEDVGKRLISCLMGYKSIPPQLAIHGPVILLASDLTPTEAAHIDPKRVAAFITCSGSRTSHTAILARALGIPAIVAVQENLENIEDGTTIALDVSSGLAIVNPDETTRNEFLRREENLRLLTNRLESESHQPTETIDGYQTCLVANVELPAEALGVKEKFNVGIGLFRTEFLFIATGKLLTEEEQFEAYRETAKALYPSSVIFRTLDIGGDKFLSQLQWPYELNPFMGTRAIRFSLRKPEIFLTQLRAILRASAYGKVRLMFPMISALEELLQALKYLDEAKEQLRQAQIPFNEDLDVGCMIEVPSAALLAERLIPYVDFFSIGTNDLVQYSLAVDRANPDIAYLYQPAHPAVLRQIQNVVNAAFSAGKWVSVCGEMAAETLYTPLLLGMGIQELSMSPVALAPVHKLIRSIKMYEAEELVRLALKANDGREVEELCRKFISKACPELLNT